MNPENTSTYYVLPPDENGHEWTNRMVDFICCNVCGVCKSIRGNKKCPGKAPKIVFKESALEKPDVCSIEDSIEEREFEHDNREENIAQLDDYRLRKQLAQSIHQQQMKLAEEFWKNGSQKHD
mgnify:CR=1 FL=1